MDIEPKQPKVPKLDKNKKYTTYKNVPIVLGTLPDDTSWWTEEDRKLWKDHVKILKESGQLGKVVYYDISIEHNEMFDYPKPQPLESYKMVLLDLNDINNG